MSLIRDAEEASKILLHSQREEERKRMKKLTHVIDSGFKCPRCALTINTMWDYFPHCGKNQINKR